jgi:hypothetical protein
MRTRGSNVHDSEGDDEADSLQEGSLSETLATVQTNTSQRLQHLIERLDTVGGSCVPSTYNSETCNHCNETEPARIRKTRPQVAFLDLKNLSKDQTEAR